MQKDAIQDDYVYTEETIFTNDGERKTTEFIEVERDSLIIGENK
ncbi:hypothetical protein P4U65_02525 [Bacillus pacificus]|nr:hypothetical protein [Bacillus thuringiensis]MED1299444.1 hypothetical protein [Bacillus pacificus]